MKKCVIWLVAVVLLLAGCASPQNPDEVYPKVGKSGDAKPYFPPEPIPVVVPIAERVDGGVKVTIHAGLLGNDTEVLTDAQKADGFIDAVRNEDDSVTYTIAEESYDAFVTRKRENAYNSILYMPENYDSVTSLECAEDLSSVDVHAIREEYLYSTEGEIVFGLGLYAVMGQMYDIDAPGTCVITVYDENGDVIEQSVYPDQLVL